MRSGRIWRLASRLERTIRLAAALFVVLAPWHAAAQITVLPRSDSLAGDFFGGAVAMHGDRILVGATGLSACGLNSGSAFLYARVPSTDDWALEAVLEPDDCEERMFFGRSVALSERFAVVAASQEFFSSERPNAVYVFERSDTSSGWRQTAKLTGGVPSQEGSFATSLSIDGQRLLVTTSGDPSGRRVQGVAYVFEYDASTSEWIRRHRLEPRSRAGRSVFGTSGALAGGVAAVSASTYFRSEPGSLYLFEADSIGMWSRTARFGSIDDFFISLDAHGNRVLVGESKARSNASGEATLYELDASGRWQLQHVFRPVKPYDEGAFGSAVALYGDVALVVGFDEQLGLNVNIDRVVFVFTRDARSGSWRQTQVIDVGEVAFGSDVDIYERYAVVGSASEQKAGAVYVVRLTEPVAPTSP